MNLTALNQSEFVSNIGDSLGATLLPRSVTRTMSPLERTLERSWLYDPFSSAGQYFAIFWSLLTASLATGGNGFVFIASVKYNALTIDQVSVSLIRNLAVTDFGCGIIVALRLAYIVTGRNVYGTLICYIFSRVFFYLLGVGTIFISALNLNKLHCLLFPMRVPFRSFRQGHIFCSLVWVSVALVWLGPVVYRLVQEVDDTSSIVFQAGGSQCTTETAAFSRTVLSLTRAAAFIFVLVPILVIIITTIWLACLVRKVVGAIQKQGVFTLIFVSVVFFSSYAPYFCFVILRDNLSTEQKNSPWFSAYFKITNLVVQANFAANPIIYCLTIRSFGAFAKTKIWRNLKHVPSQWLHRMRVRLGAVFFWVATMMGRNDVNPADEEPPNAL